MHVHLTDPQSQFYRLTCPYPAFVAGFGTGKSQVLVTSAINDVCTFKGANIGLYSPIHDLNALNLIPRAEEMLDGAKIRHKVNAGRGIIHIKKRGYGDMIFRSMDNPARIVAYETFRGHVDELDTMAEKKAREAWNKIIARNRQNCNHRITGLRGMNRVSAYTTPEGFRFVYKRWKQKPTKKYQMVQASTYSNPHLDPSYIENLIDTYPANLIQAYLHGDFVNLTSGTVYHCYSRDTCNSTEEIISKKGEEEDLYIGMDFNVTQMAATIYVKRKKIWHAVEELFDVYDTPAMVKLIKERYKDKGHTIYTYPDASGGSRSTKNASISDLSLIEQAGFFVRAKASNPAVKDRVAAMNAGLEKGRVKINHGKCPRTAECLEQQIYTKAGEPDKTQGVDHQNDATTYPIAMEMPIIRPIPELKVRFSV